MDVVLVVLLMTVGFLQCTNSMATAHSWLLFRIALLQCTLFLTIILMATVYNMLLPEIIQLKQCISNVNIDSMATDSDYSLLLLEFAQCIFIAQCYQQYNRILLQQQQDDSPVTGTAQQDDIPVTGTVQQEDDSPVTCTAVQETGEQWLTD